MDGNKQPRLVVEFHLAVFTLWDVFVLAEKINLEKLWLINKAGVTRCSWMPMYALWSRPRTCPALLGNSNFTVEANRRPLAPHSWRAGVLSTQHFITTRNKRQDYRLPIRVVCKQRVETFISIKEKRSLWPRVAFHPDSLKGKRGKKSNSFTCVSACGSVTRWLVRCHAMTDKHKHALSVISISTKTSTYFLLAVFNSAPAL